MQKIAWYIKNGRGSGALVVLIFSAFVAFYSAFNVKTILPKAVPYVQQAVDEFCPIRVQNGKVVVPEETIKTHAYQLGDEKIWLILDTTKDFLEQEDVRNGITITRSYIYTINKDDIRRQSLKGNFVLEKQDYTPVLNKLIDWLALSVAIIGPFLNFAIFILLVLFYAFCTGFACTLNKTELLFKTKMRLNTVLFISVYLLSSVLSFAGVKISMLAFFLLMIALQIICVKKISATSEKKAD
ncbi:MAG: DUF1189 family protein [Alphaproteobacteria bacterium]|nr:DUF1189 family protein [Alphaproteobacteria bacterium]